MPAFGVDAPRFLIVGLAPGMHGANRTGRPFTGDYAGELLLPHAARNRFRRSGRCPSVPRTACDCAMRAPMPSCVPLANKPTPAEIRSCNAFLAHELATLASVRVVLALGRIAHDAVSMRCS
ncbi:MAG: uracil-DNA glycosylase family protein [Steroidobacteraceae bacterium]